MMLLKILKNCRHVSKSYYENYLLPYRSIHLALNFALLKEQVDDFTNMIREIDDQQSSSASAASAVTTTLSHAKFTLERLKILLEVKLSPRASGSSRKSRRAWAKNRSKLYRIQSSLKEHKTNLLLAIATNNLSVLATFQASYSAFDKLLGLPLLDQKQHCYLSIASSTIPTIHRAN